MKTKPNKIYKSCPQEESIAKKKSFKLFHPLVILKSLYFISLEDTALDR